MRWPLLLLCTLDLVGACKHEEAALAELTQADGPVEQEKGGPPWATAAIGTEFFLGDAARTADGGAQLKIAGGAQIAMQKHTVLRFGKGGQNKIAVELGAIDLSGTGNYGLDIGEVRLAKNGSVRITAQGGGKSTVKLTLGEAQVTAIDGKTIDLALNTDVDVTLDVVATPLRDAGVVAIDAAAVVDAGAEPDAGVAVASEATVEVTGKKAEIQLAGEPKWKPLAAGSSELAAGAKVRLGANTTAKLVAKGTTLDIAGGTRIAVSATFDFALEAGGGRVAMTAEGTVKLPGGAVAMRGSEKQPFESRLDAAATGTKITVQRGGAKLTGASGSELDMNRGESATLLKNGTIRPLEAIPTYFDFRLTAGDGGITIHDPRPPVAVQFQFGGKCLEGGIVELDKDARFRSAKISGGKEAVNHLVKTGGWYYRLRCTAGAREGNAVAQGRIAVVADGGTRSLPTKPGVNPFVIDGRPWSYSYQSAIPDLAVTFPGAGSRFRLHLARGGKDLTFDSTTTSLKVLGSSLSEGTYTYWFDRDGVKQDKVNQLKIDFDQTAPQVYIEQPVNGRPWSGDIDVKGAVLPGWTAAVADVAIPVDPKTRRFGARVGTPAGNALAIRLSHPQRGVHYYLRRQK